MSRHLNEALSCAGSTQRCSQLGLRVAQVAWQTQPTQGSFASLILRQQVNALRNILLATRRCSFRAPHDDIILTELAGCNLTVKFQVSSRTTDNCNEGVYPSYTCLFCASWRISYSQRSSISKTCIAWARNHSYICLLYFHSVFVSWNGGNNNSKQMLVTTVMPGKPARADTSSDETVTTFRLVDVCKSRPSLQKNCINVSKCRFRVSSLSMQLYSMQTVM